MAKNERLQELRKRIDALAAGPLPRRILGPRRRAPKTPQLLALDVLLDEVGVFTLADARALAELALAHDADLAPVAGTLRRKTSKGLRELEDRVLHEERRAWRQRRVPSEALADLEDLWTRLSRIAAVAKVIADPSAPVAQPFEPMAMPRRADPAQSERVAVAEFLLGRCRSTAFDARQKRRDLAAAHELLLRIGSTLEQGRVQKLRAEVSRARRSVDRLGNLDSVQAIDLAAKRGKGGEVWAHTRQLYLDALASGDARLAGAARGLLSELQGMIPKGLPDARKNDRAASLVDDAGAGAMSAVLAGDGRSGEGERDRLGEIASELDGEKWSVFELAAGFGNFFEVEGDEEIILSVGPPTRVPYPSSQMAIDVAHSTAEAPNFVVTDPRTILYDLASDRQLVRAWYEPGVVEKRRRTSVRVYVCDASGSMQGHRARFRDAVLVAELNNLSSRAAQGLRYSPLYFCFFNDKPSDLELVDTPRNALEQVQKLLRASPAGGQTDITFALEAAFGAIREARGKDPELARATVVLVTDGDDRVDLERIELARKPAKGLEIALSFIALGKENPDLKKLVLQQRDAGKRAFYYHLADEEITAGRTAFDTGQRTLLPARPQVELGPTGARNDKLRAALDTLRSAARPPAAEHRSMAEGRFVSYFTPPPSTGMGQLPTPALVARAQGILDALVETVSMAPSERRRLEAVELLEHLLRAYRLSSAEWFSALGSFEPQARQKLGDINLLCPPPGGSQ
ncbi:MAG TPA: vWA domain-containing protein [Myxococcales bacterium]